MLAPPVTCCALPPLPLAANLHRQRHADRACVAANLHRQRHADRACVAAAGQAQLRQGRAGYPEAFGRTGLPGGFQGGQRPRSPCQHAGPGKPSQATHDCRPVRQRSSVPSQLHASRRSLMCSALARLIMVLARMACIQHMADGAAAECTPRQLSEGCSPICRCVGYQGRQADAADACGRGGPWSRLTQTAPRFMAQGPSPGPSLLRGCLPDAPPLLRAPPAMNR